MGSKGEEPAEQTAGATGRGDEAHGAGAPELTDRHHLETAAALSNRICAAGRRTSPVRTLRMLVGYSNRAGSPAPARTTCG